MKSFKLATVTLLVAAAALSTSAFAKDGTYTAQEVGRNGAVKVQVIVKGNKIESVKVLDWSETHPVADLTQTQLIPEIVKYQTTNVNNISGATLSSFAIKAAVNKCLKEAGLDVKQFQKPAPKPAHYNDTVTEDTNIVIVGAGGAGLSAAVAAAESGKKVILLEKNGFAGGNTSVSGGCFNVANRNQDHLTMSEGQKKIVEGIINQKPLNPLHAELINKVKDQWTKYKESASKLGSQGTTRPTSTSFIH